MSIKELCGRTKRGYTGIIISDKAFMFMLLVPKTNVLTKLSKTKLGVLSFFWVPGAEYIPYCIRLSSLIPSHSRVLHIMAT